MNYWLTVHVPPLKSESRDAVHSSVWLQDGHKAAGDELKSDDLVFIYQQKTGRTAVELDINGSKKEFPCHEGRRGVVAIGKVTGVFLVNTDHPLERYTDGTEAIWRWRAPLNLVSRSGFVRQEEVAAALGYSSTYNFRGFGDKKSGLKKLDPSQFETIRKLFHSSVPTENLNTSLGQGGHQYGNGGESQSHLDLKEYVAANPSKVLNESEVTTVAVERAFTTGDCADIVLKDRFGKIIGLEIEVHIPTGDLTGPLQAIKYRRMLEMATDICHGDGRAVLVAYSISADVQKVCERYEVECIEIEEKEVHAWRISSGGK